MSCCNHVLPGPGKLSPLSKTCLRPPLCSRVTVRTLGCLTHCCSVHGGARALTPTPPSVTCASRVRLFPRYVVSSSPPPPTVTLRDTRNKQAQKGGRCEDRSGSSVTVISSLWTEGAYTYKLPSVKPKPPVRLWLH